MTPLYETSPEADEDIGDIIIYTVERWGVAQVRKYIAGLEKRMQEMATGKAHLKRFKELGGGVKVSRYEHHYIFAVDSDDLPMVVLAIFHESMDMMARFKKRMG